MTSNILKQTSFKDLMCQHCLSILQYLIAKNIHFGVLCNKKHIISSPQIPEQILANADEHIFFYFKDYTFSTLIIDKSKISFETGFGDNSIPYFVDIPISFIVNIIVDNEIFFINKAAISSDEKIQDQDKSNLKDDEVKKQDEDTDSIKKDIVSINPKNKHFFS